jgi:hypothetical protein
LAYELNTILGLFIHSFIIDNPGLCAHRAAKAEMLN